jgi:uncharacterized protein
MVYMNSYYPEFSNDQVFLKDVPSIDHIKWQGLDPRFKNLMYLGSISNVSLTVIWVAVAFIFDFWSIPLLAYGVLFLTISFFGLGMWLVHLAFPIKAYAIRERDILYRTGLLFRSITIVPFDRVQHCEIHRGLLSRLMGLSQVNVYTAGGSGSDISIPGLTAEEAERISAYIIGKTKQQADEEE